MNGVLRILPFILLAASNISWYVGTIIEIASFKKHIKPKMMLSIRREWLLIAAFPAGYVYFATSAGEVCGICRI